MESIHLEDPLISYFLGLLHTDGCHSGDVEHKGRVQIELSERDADVLRALARALPVKATLSTRTRQTNFTGEKFQTTCTLSIYAQEFRRWLSEMRMPTGPKSATVGPPNGAYSRHAYLRGVLDGDGSVGFTRADSPSISFVSASRDLAEFVADAIHETSGKKRTLNRTSRDGVFNVYGHEPRSRPTRSIRMAFASSHRNSPKTGCGPDGCTLGSAGREGGALRRRQTQVDAS